MIVIPFAFTFSYDDLSNTLRSCRFDFWSFIIRRHRGSFVIDCSGKNFAVVASRGEFEAVSVRYDGGCDVDISCSS